MSKAKTSKDGWIRHRGGKCPVDGEIHIEYRLRCGDVYKYNAGAMDWSHNNDSGDIMAYRICEPVQSTYMLEWEERDPSAAKQADELTDPLQWRDRIYELAAQQEEITEVYNRQSSEIAAERESLIQRLESEGFRLIGTASKVAETVEDMSDWHNWKVGDHIEVIAEGMDGCCKGDMLIVSLIDSRDARQPLRLCEIDDDLTHWPVVPDGHFETLKWHSRPSAQ